MTRRGTRRLWRSRRTPSTPDAAAVWCRRSTPRAWPPWSWRRSGRRHYGWGSPTRPRSAACAATWREAAGRLVTTWACGAAASPRMPTMRRTPPHPAPRRCRFPTPRPRSLGCCQTSRGFPTPLACLPAAVAAAAAAAAVAAVAVAVAQAAEMAEAGSRPRRCTASTSKSCCQGGLMRAGSSAPCVTHWRSATHTPHQQPQPQPQPQGRRVARL